MENSLRELDKELFSAAKQGSLSQVKNCLRNGADVLARSSHHTILHSAVSSDNKEVVKLILDKIKDMQGNVSPYIDDKDTEGDTPLMWSAQSKYLNSAKILLEYGANIETKNNEGMTALHWAAKKNHVEIMKLLIGKGANVDVKNKYDQTPLDVAKKERHGVAAGFLEFCEAEMFRKQGKYNEAWQAYQAAFDIQSFYLDPDHLDTLMTRHNMAVVLANQRKYREALVIYEEVFDIQKRSDVFGPDHPYTLITHYNMKLACGDQDNNNDVLRFIPEVFEGLELVSDNPIALTSSNIKIVEQNIIRKKLPESEFSNVLSDLEDRQEVLKLDEECFLSESSELEAIRKNVAEHLKYRFQDLVIVRGKDKGKNAWQYVLVDQGRMEMFVEETKKGFVGSFATAYSKILYSDWGENPPKNITDEVEDFFQRKVYRDLFVMKEKCYNMSLYHYILIDSDKKEIFLEQSNKGLFLFKNIKDYGIFLYSGWGQDPPESISNRIVRAYFFTEKRELEGVLPEHLITKCKVLHDAARKNKLEALRGFLTVSSVDTNGWTSLHHAAYIGNLETVKYLISHGASLHIKDAVCGRIPLHIAAREGHDDIVEFLLTKFKKYIDVDKNDWTPLHYAAWNGHLSTVQLLIALGADLYADEAALGRKPIHIAAERGYMSIVEYFLSFIKTVDVTDRQGRTLLYYAAWRGHLEVVKFLVNRNANIHAKNIYGSKPIHIAAIGGWRNVLEFLLDCGAEVNDCTNNKCTPLHLAAAEGQSEVVKFLVIKGANIDSRNDKGEAPSDIARTNGNKEILDILDNLK